MPQDLNRKPADLVGLEITWKCCPRARLHPEGPEVPVMNHFGPLGRRVKPPLRKCATVIRQGAAVLHPTVETGVDVPVDICEMGRELVPTQRLTADEREHVPVAGVGGEVAVVRHRLHLQSFQDEPEAERAKGARVGELRGGVVAGRRRRNLTHSGAGHQDGRGERERLGAKVHAVAVDVDRVGDPSTLSEILQTEEQRRRDQINLSEAHGVVRRLQIRSVDRLVFHFGS